MSSLYPTMHWLTYIFPQICARYSTKYNPDIRVVEENGQYKLVAQGARESGPFIRGLWKKALVHFEIHPTRPVKSILVLGVAGGTVIHLLADQYPEARIDGVDIDERMIEIGKKYFALDKISHLHMHVLDARAFLKKAIQNKQSWDIAVTDLFIGVEIPEFSEQVPFLRDVRSVITPGGRLLINYNYYDAYIHRSDVLYTKLQSLFAKTENVIIQTNRFYSVGS